MSPENTTEGQFDDAPSDPAAAVMDDQQDPRLGGYFIDDEQILEWSDENSEVDDLNEDDFEDPRADDEDWEVAERGELHLFS